MPVSPFTKFYSFVEALAEKAHKLDTDALKVMLTNTLPAQTSTKYADISSTELAAAGGYTAGGKAVGFTGLTSAQSGGIYKLVLPDVIFTATAAMGPFRYAVLYNDGDVATPKGLIGFWDNGAPVTLANTETFTVDFDGTTGVIQLQ